MSIQLVREEEKLTYAMGGSKIFYRRVPAVRRALAMKKHTRKGKTDWSAVGAELLEWAIVGWDDVKDGEAQVKFDPELIGRLPEDVRTDLVELTGAAMVDDDKEDGPGNS